MEPYQVCFFKTRSWPSLEEKLIVGIPIFLFVLLGFVANGFIFLTILTRLRTMLIAGKIHYLLANACFAQCIYLSAHFVSSLPGMFSLSPIFGETTMLILSAPNTLGYYTVLLSNFVIAIDRFVSLFGRTFYSKHATNIGIGGILFVWVLSLMFVVMQGVNGCHKRFNQWMMTFSYGCNGINCNRYFIFGITFMDFLTFFGQIICCIMFVLYLACFLNIAYQQRHMNTSTARNKRNLMVVIQLFCIFISQWATSTCLIFGVKLFGASLITTFISNFSGIMNANVNAIFLLCFNRKLRLHFRTSWFGAQLKKTLRTLIQRQPLVGSNISTVEKMPRVILQKPVAVANHS